MLILLAAIFALILAVGIVFLYYAKYYRNIWHGRDDDKRYKFGRIVNSFDAGETLCWIGGVLLGVVLFAILIVGVEASNTMIIDDKIAMYEVENETINQEINVIVENYQKHEKDTFSSATKKLSPTVVFSLYPELKSNTLVAKQIDTYTANQKEIKALKSKKLDYEVYKWWLHF